MTPKPKPIHPIQIIVAPFGNGFTITILNSNLPPPAPKRLSLVADSAEKMKALLTTAAKEAGESLEKAAAPKEELDDA